MTIKQEHFDDYLDNQLLSVVSRLSDKHTTQTAPIIPRGTLHMLLDFSGIFKIGEGGSSKNSIKVSQSINRLVDRGLLVKNVKANGKSSVNLPTDGISKPYFEVA
jgi:hypothetical protein